MPSSRPRPPQPGPVALSLSGSTRPPCLAGPKMAAARPTPPARPPSCAWLGPARWARLSQSGSAARPAPPRPSTAPGRARRSPHHGGRAARAAARPHRAPTGKGRTRHPPVTTWMCLRPLTAASAAPAGQPPTPAQVRNRAPAPVPLPIRGSSAPPRPSRTLRAPLSRSVPHQSRGLCSGGGIRVTRHPPLRDSPSAGGREVRLWRGRWRQSGGAGRAAAWASFCSGEGRGCPGSFSGGDRGCSRGCPGSCSGEGRGCSRSCSGGDRGHCLGVSAALLRGVWPGLWGGCYSGCSLGVFNVCSNFT